MSAAPDPPVDEPPAPRTRRLLPTSAHRRAVVILLIATLMGGLFVASYVVALGRPTARALDIAVVGTAPEDDAFARALQTAATSGVRYTRYPTAAAAERAVGQQKTYAVLLLSPGQPPRLELSSASGSSVTRILTTAASTAGQQAGASPALTDLRPLPRTDPSGLAEFYLTLAGTIIGFVATFQLRANASPLGLRSWLVATGALAVLGSLFLVVLTSTVLDAPFPILTSWLLLGLQMATASAFASTMSVLVGRWAILPTWLLFVVLGNTSSGGAVSPALLPQPFNVLSRLLPSGATVSGLRSAAYFPTASGAEPLLVLLLWTVATVGTMLAVCLRRGRSPGVTG